MKILVLLVVLCLLPLPAIHADSIEDSLNVYGVFLPKKKNSHIQIYDCGDNTPCGKVVWINPESLEEGVTPESAVTKVGKKVLGMVILEGFSARQKDWRGGTIYDPEADKTYKSRLKRLPDGSLQVKGCIAFLCQTQVWTEAASEQSNSNSQ